MVVNRKPSGTAKPMPIGLAMGWIVEMVITVVTCMLIAALILNGKTGWGTMGYGTMGTLLLSAYLGATISSKLVGRRKAMVCALSGGIYLCTLLLAAFLLFDGGIESMWLPALLVAGGAALAGLFHGSEKQGKTRRRRRR